jgi:hypothetical protein
VGVGEALGVAVAVDDAVGVADDDAVAVALADAVAVAEAEAVGVALADAVGVGDDDAVAVALADAVAVELADAVAVGDAEAVGVALADAVGVAEGVGVGPKTCTESLSHVAYISVELTSYRECPSVKLMELLLQWKPITSKVIQERVPLPEAPLIPGRLLMILTVPWVAGGMKLQLVTLIIVPLIKPLKTLVTSMISGS